MKLIEVIFLCLLYTQQACFKVLVLTYKLSDVHELLVYAKLNFLQW